MHLPGTAHFSFVHVTKCLTRLIRCHLVLILTCSIWRGFCLHLVKEDGCYVSFAFPLWNDPIINSIPMLKSSELLVEFSLFSQKMSPGFNALL